MTEWFEFDEHKNLWQAINEVILDELDDAMEELIHEFENYADNQLRQGDFDPAIGKGAFNTGDLAGAWDLQFKYLEKVIENNSPYVEFVEFGTPPHRKPPPIDPIRLWTYEKLLYRGEKLEKVTDAIRWNIALYGTHPRPFFRRSYEHITHPKTITAILDRKFK